MRRSDLWRWAGTAAIGAFGCTDPVVEIARLGGSERVATVSAVRAFEGAPAAQSPAPGVIAYEVNAPLYSDHARKRRFMWVPPGTRVRVNDGRWELPVGAVLVKTFWFPVDARAPERGERLIETRFLVRTAAGFEAATYVWNAAQTDATASGGNVDIPVEWIDAQGAARRDLWHVPGTSQCDSCHRQRALGLRTAQLDRAGVWTDGARDQLDHLLRAGVLDALPQSRAPLADPTGDGPIDARARSYLDANCGHCHAPDGEAADTEVFFDHVHTAAPSFRCRATEAVDGADRVLVPGRPGASEMLARMRSTDPFVRMPRGPSRVPDGEGIGLLSDWIVAMTPAGCP